ncbi:UDP-N-acetylglucosamine--undecaprenyl-phosphate N-acetylglucosaminephosphotransferase [Vibrio tapetis subsp. quintayensis]|uniref:UDP-N-acetylglucosamine--undecaprenyl-phosphate N-acetylglucosaminephosphotransferase n=1 Tax=Vibrio tapetis TaxID=52443 RepID=UPI0025B3B7E6|nr:UDP-N-acetylglucosamine--undecaprenyl-phosphate N-acetylglucosaminephosphotransferase [Vibrio tapetis]MDN3679465.1 UDP-N-acetylglucosamine--undecaprenyl-phosphate N-acetylglucosaminephosphotransferase [Vibrio tapetis subsp. quintayensis]
MAFTLLGVFVFASVLLIFGRKLAQQVQLVDKPNHRKHHSGAIPLIGGIVICIALCFMLAFQPTVVDNQQWLIFSMLILTSMGVWDDKNDLCCNIRMAVQALLSIGMIFIAGIELHTFGNLFGHGDVDLGGLLSTAITIIAVIGAINAFNMVDGIDGLLGGLSIITFLAMGILLTISDQPALAMICFALIAALIPFMAFNLGLFGQKRKVFMGDAGSMMIGFLAIWILLQMSQPNQLAVIRPVTVLWLIAVPLTDMVAIMYRRIRKGQSPLKPDREHLHHICQRIGLSNTQTLIFIYCVAAAYGAFGIYGEMHQIPENTMFISFLVCFGVYVIVLSHIWRITSFIRARKDKQQVFVRMND